MKQKYFIVIIACTIIGCKMSGQKKIMDPLEHKIGECKIYLLAEKQGSGNLSILQNATEAMIQNSIPKGTYPNGCNAFLVQTPAENILIDAAFGQKLEAQLLAIGLRAENIHKIFITHMHSDHIGGLLNNDEARFKQAKLYIAQSEYDYWKDKESAQKVLDVYKENLVLFQPGTLENGGEALVPEIRAIAAYGHTPGHTVYLVESNQQKLLIWGDLTHAMAIQMPYPQVTVTYDVDPQKAALSRMEILEYVVLHKIEIAGMHIAYPGMGRIEKNRQSGYQFTPID